MSDSNSKPTRSIDVGLFLVSAATLTLEIHKTRVFSVLLWHHVTYIVVTLTLLGFTAAGAFLTVFPRLAEERVRGTLAWSSLGFALTTIGAFWVVSHQSFDSTSVLTNKWTYFLIAGYYAYLVVPFFFAGLAITAALTARAKDVSRLYFINLVGSGVGCWLLVLLLTPLGGERMVFFCAALAALAAMVFAEPRSLARRASVVSLLALVGTGAFADRLMPLGTAPDKVGSLLLGKETTSEKGEKTTWQLIARAWSPLCRIDVIGVPGDPLYIVCQDGDAPTTIRRADEAAVEEHVLTPYALGYRLFDGKEKRPDVLIIGPGGGPDLIQALRNDARSITAAEINGVTASLMRNEFKEYTNGLYDREGIDVHVAEGRSFMRRSKRTYDLIQMTGTDTYTALSSGAYVLSESYLYTREAFEEYFDHLSEDGVLCVLRFRFDPPRESLRLAAIGQEVLRDRGAEDPGRHVIVIENEVLYPYHSAMGEAQQVVKYAITLFKREPFTQEEVFRYLDWIRGRADDFASKGSPQPSYLLGYAPPADLAAWKDRHPGVAVDLASRHKAYLDGLVHVLKANVDTTLPEGLEKLRPIQTMAREALAAGQDLRDVLRRSEKVVVYPDRDAPLDNNPPYVALAEAIRSGKERAFYDSYPYVVSPVTDDAPFFFKYHRWGSLFGSKVEQASYEDLYGDEPIGLFVLLALLLEMIVLVALLVIVPLLVVRRSELKAKGALRSFVYFTALGAGFILIEIVYLQKFVLFLGHPVHSLTVTLSSFLVFSGLGSFFSNRFRPGPKLVRTAVYAIVALVVLNGFLLPVLFQTFLDQSTPMRIVIAIAALAPLNFAMGIPFPTGIRILERTTPRFIPWAFGVNGGASVIGSVLCIILALAIGFHAVSFIAAGVYLVGALVFTRGLSAA
ncbi:MAG: hypothetical protein H6834_15390 [Planctomycetes bacterium]|nr:hypothetical protein [Planctomycetota bacterium]